MLSLGRGEAIRITRIADKRFAKTDTRLDCLQYMLHLEGGRKGWLSASDLRTQRSRMDPGIDVDTNLMMWCS